MRARRSWHLEVNHDARKIVQSFAVLAIALHLPFHRRLSWACAAPGDIFYDSLIETNIMCRVG
jgi:hypothetical protein